MDTYPSVAITLSVDVNRAHGKFPRATIRI